jgi:hypothetical protein
MVSESENLRMRGEDGEREKEMGDCIGAIY